MELSRRDFLKAAGAGTAGLVVLPSILDGDLKAFAREPDKKKPIVFEKIIMVLLTMAMLTNLVRQRLVWPVL